MRLIPTFTAFLCYLIRCTSAADPQFVPVRPPALPLAVKSPYLSTWVNAGSNGGNGGFLAGEWPTHWTGKSTGWVGLIRVDGETYQWMGNTGIENVQQISYEYTSTKSIFTMDVASKVQVTVTFLSPITPSDYARLSLPFSYMRIDVKGTDNRTHCVQVYTDISAEWASGERDVTAQWDYDTQGGISYHKISRQQQIPFAESDEPGGNGMASWGEVFYATDNVTDLTRQSGHDTVVREQFQRNGNLTNGVDVEYRAINDRWPVFAFANDLGEVGSNGTARSVIYTIGLAQDEVVQYLGDDGLQAMPAFWRSHWKSSTEACIFFHTDYTNMEALSTKLDSQINSDSIRTAGQNYATLTTLAVRQAFAGLQLAGTPENMYVFMKEISSNGNMQTVDVMFPLHPILLCLNPDLLRMLLKPLFENQESGKYPNKWAMHDLGSHYPNATGHPAGDDEAMPVEECGNMLLMSLAYAQRTKDTTWLAARYRMLSQWAEFLIEYSLIPANQLSTDDFAGQLHNQTNLALKGIIGIEAMAAIASMTNRTDEARNYSRISHEYIAEWQDLGITKNSDPPHTTLSYGNETSYGLLYNLWPDRAFGLNLVPQSVYDMQSAFYPTVALEYGVPLDTRHTWTKSDWMLWTAATCSISTRDMFLEKIAHWVNVTPTSKPLTDLFDVVTGDHPPVRFFARPVVGGFFALLVSGRTDAGYTAFEGWDSDGALLGGGNETDAGRNVTVEAGRLPHVRRSV